MLFRHAIFIGAAGFVGAIARFLVASGVAVIAPRGFPYGTLTVNITGCFLLATFLTLFRDRAATDGLRLAIAVGFIGAYTTFSTFAQEIYDLWKTSRTSSVFYASASVALGVAAVWVGVRFAHFIERPG